MNEYFLLTVEEVEGLMAVYGELPDELMDRMQSVDGSEPALARGLAVLHRMYHWNREHFTMGPGTAAR